MQFPIKFGQNRTLLLVIMLICVFILNGCDSKQTQKTPPPTEVGTMTMKEQKVVLTSELPGRTCAYLISEVRPQVSGIIQKRLFKEGSIIKEGEVLYQIDSALFQAAYNSARASLARAEANLPSIRLRTARYKELLSSKAVSQQDFDDADAALKQAEAEVEYWKAAVESARINLGYTRVTAPISGHIGKSNVTEGALVTANQPAPLATIQQLNPIYVDVPQSTTELLRLKRRLEEGHLAQNGESQQKVDLILEDGVPYSWEGTLEFRDITVDASTGTVTLRAVFPNPEDTLLPGMFVRAVVKEGANNHAVLVPQKAVSRDPKGTPLALIVDAEGKVQQRQLTIDRAIGNQWLIASGLVPGEQIIVEGIQKVRAGMPVKAVPCNEPLVESSTAESAAQPSVQ